MKAKEIITSLEKEGITRYRIFKDTGIAQSTLCRWFDGERNPSPALVAVLKNYYNQKVKESAL